jgi:hypothetical protein
MPSPFFGVESQIPALVLRHMAARLDWELEEDNLGDFLSPGLDTLPDELVATGQQLLRDYIARMRAAADRLDPLRVLGPTPHPTTDPLTHAVTLIAEVAQLVDEAQKGCGCTETWPQLRPPHPAHGPGCALAPASLVEAAAKLRMAIFSLGAAWMEGFFGG